MVGRGALSRARFSNRSLLIDYRRTWLRADVLAGLTVAAYLVPQVMAYAQVAGLPAIAGLWAMLPCIIFYAVLGSSRQLSVGPESTTALLTASVVGPLAAGDPARYASLAAELALVFGLLCLGAWLYCDSGLSLTCSPALCLSDIWPAWRSSWHSVSSAKSPARMHDVDDFPSAEQVPGALFYRYDSPLFFANAEDFTRRVLGAVDEYSGELSWFVLNVEAIVEVDITGLDALESVRHTLAAKGIVVALARVKQDLLDDLEAYGLADTIGRERLYPTLPTALAAYQAWRARPKDDPRSM